MSPEQLIANVLVAIIRRHVCEASTFTDEVFGDGVHELHTELAWFVTGDEANARNWWTDGFGQIYMKGGDWNGHS